MMMRLFRVFFPDDVDDAGFQDKTVGCLPWNSSGDHNSDFMNMTWFFFFL